MLKYLTAPRSPETEAKARAKRWTFGIAVLLGVPLAATILGSITAPQKARMLPTGRLLYLEADQPSERTTTLRGLYIVTPSGQSRLILHENEPQDTDTGIREWISQPAASPDGHWGAFIRQNIVLQESKQSQESEICVVSLDSPASGSTGTPPVVIYSISKSIKKQIVGLCWSPDSKSVNFMSDSTRYAVNRQTPYSVSTTQFVFNGNLPTNTLVSATQYPQIGANGQFACMLQQGARRSILIGRNVIGDIDAFALSPDGSRVAFVSTASPKTIVVADSATGSKLQTLPVKYGWSIFGRRKVTSLQWSPDQSAIAYGVMKLPVPDDEIFFTDLRTGIVHLIPERSGSRSWTWAPGTQL